jgi:hypothetical protein
VVHYVQSRFIQWAKLAAAHGSLLFGPPLYEYQNHVFKLCKHEIQKEVQFQFEHEHGFFIIILKQENV